MPAGEGRYIHIPEWWRSQDRPTTWIKDYPAELDSDAYLELSFHNRGILHDMRRIYARLNPDRSATTLRGISDSTLTLTRRLGKRVATRDLESLNHAGLIVFGDVTVPSQRRSREEKSREEKSREDRNTPLSPLMESAFRRLRGVGKPGFAPPAFTRERFGRLAEIYDERTVVLAAEALADWEIFGNGADQETKDGMKRLRNWLKKDAESAPWQPAPEPEVDYPLLPVIEEA